MCVRHFMFSCYSVLDWRVCIYRVIIFYSCMKEFLQNHHFEAKSNDKQIQSTVTGCVVKGFETLKRDLNPCHCTHALSTVDSNSVFLLFVHV